MHESSRNTGFAENLMAPGRAVIDVARFRKRFGLSQQALASIAKVHRTTVGHAPSNEKLQRPMRDSLLIVSAAVATAGDEDRAVYWMRNTPIPEFDHRVAMDLVADGRTEAVVKYLSSIESGSSG